MTAFMNDENPDNAVNRFELLEVSCLITDQSLHVSIAALITIVIHFEQLQAILRIATFRFPCIGHWDDYPDATVLKVRGSAFVAIVVSFV